MPGLRLISTLKSEKGIFLPRHCSCGRVGNANIYVLSICMYQLFECNMLPSPVIFHWFCFVWWCFHFWIFEELLLGLFGLNVTTNNTVLYTNTNIPSYDIDAANLIFMDLMLISGMISTQKWWTA
jgi:hypothetical protein